MIVGLGNPGSEYDRTRHNAGFLAVERLGRRHAPEAIPRQKFGALTLEAMVPAGGARCMLMKPMTYMNRSGRSVGEAVRFYKLDPAEDLLVLVDDLALPAGAIRLRASGSAGGHNGLADIERVLGTSGYARCRIGIDGPGQMRQHDYVLGRFSPDQVDAVDGALDRACDAAEVWATDGITPAMNRFNASSAASGDDGRH